VIPTVHYVMGGIPTTIRAEVVRPTKDDPDAVVPGLMAIGEAACVSVHGANRLGTNSLLDLIVFGRAAALRTAEIVKPGSQVRDANGQSEERALQRFDRVRHSKGGNKPGEVRPQMQEAMQSGFAVFRRGDTLREGLDKLQALRDPLERVTVDDDSLQWNVALVSALELANLADQAVAIAHSACERTGITWSPRARRLSKTRRCEPAEAHLRVDGRGLERHFRLPPGPPQCALQRGAELSHPPSAPTEQMSCTRFHPLPTLPHQGGGLANAAPCLPPP
jgi:succinate dehydrogenase/fumarate reductase flavoprotein subunit